jgi:hypothetical protein
MAYGTLSVLKGHYLSHLSSATDDGALTMLLANAQKIVDAETGLTFEAATATRYYDPTADCEDSLTLNLGYPLLTVTTLTNGDSSVIASTDYVLQPVNDTPKWKIKLKASKGHYWTYTDDPETAISVAGTWGWSATAPADIQQATYRLVAWMYASNDAHVFDTTAITEIGQVTVAHRIPADIMALLAPYRRML